MERWREGGQVVCGEEKWEALKKAGFLADSMAAWNRSPGKLDQQDGGQPHPHRDQSLAGLHGSYRIRITVATSRQPSGSFCKLVRGVGDDL